MTKALSFHVEQCDGLNHLAWCVWEHNQYNKWPNGFSFVSADKISHSKPIRPNLIKAIESVRPDNVIFLEECQIAKDFCMDFNYCIEFGYKHCYWEGLQKWEMDETLLARGRDLAYLRDCKIPENLLFQPDLIFDEGFEGCILQGDAIRHDDTALLLSKAFAIGAIHIAQVIGVVNWVRG